MLPPELKIERMTKLCSQETPAIIISRDMDVPQELIDASNENNVPVLIYSHENNKIFK